MVNSDNGKILNELINSVATVYNWKNFYEPIIKEVVNIPDTIKILYTGRYDLWGTPVTITLEDGDMVIEYKNMKYPLYFISNTEFFLTEFYSVNRFIINSAGKITGFFIHGNTLVKKN